MIGEYLNYGSDYFKREEDLGEEADKFGEVEYFGQADKDFWISDDYPEIKLSSGERLNMPFIGDLLPKLAENENLVMIDYPGHAEFWLLSDEALDRCRNGQAPAEDWRRLADE